MRITQRVAAAGMAGVIGLGGLGVATMGGAFAVAAPEGTTVAAQEVDQDVCDGPDMLRDRDGGGPAADGQGARQGQGARNGAGPMSGTVAEILGLTQDELREAMSQEDTTLADLAEDQDVATATLVEGLVAAHTERIQDRVDDGRLSQDAADARIAELTERVTAMVEDGVHDPVRDRDRDRTDDGDRPGDGQGRHGQQSRQGGPTS
jgi:hypothetical protein